jgi:hypothetical protein
MSRKTETEAVCFAISAFFAVKPDLLTHDRRPGFQKLPRVRAR